MSKADFIEKQKLLYRSLKPCYCKAIGEIVHFNSTGLNHLLYNRRRPRNINEQAYRAALISYISEVIEHGAKAVLSRSPEFNSNLFWIIEHTVKSLYKGRDQTIKVILQKHSNGSTYFLSVMQK